MKIYRSALLLSLSLFVAACTCRPHKQMETYAEPEENISVATADSPIRDINFAFDSYALSPLAKDILRQNADIIRSKSLKVEVEGHCDERGTNEYNMVLGAKRARAAMEYLVALGIPASSMSTVSYGEELPLDPRHNEEAWAKNRRAHFKVLP